MLRQRGGGYIRGMPVPDLIEADLTWIDGRFEPGVTVSLAADGRIAAVTRGAAIPGAGAASRAGGAASPARRRLRGVALVPGFVTAHSHAFQRGLRGLGERFPDGAGDFFSWREAMYALVESLDEARAEELSRQAFEEMLDAGYTSVGEFHYIRHLSPERRFALDDAVLSAAASAGIRIVLLHTAYEAGGFDVPLRGGQRRFETRGVDDYWREHERLSRDVASIRDGLASIGVVAHSVRAVPWPTIKLLRRGSRERGQVFHMHVEEVQREVEDCVAAHDRRPMRMVVDELEPGSDFTAIHCTHTLAADLEDFAKSGATACLCPSTEGNLGDGICDLPTLRASGGSIAVGTDLNSRFSPQEELRWLEYVQRVARTRRGVIVDDRGETGPALLRIGTEGGAKSLSLDAGRIRPGALADLCAIDLEHASLEGASAEMLASAIVFGTGPECVLGTWVGGRFRARRGSTRCL
ncbi:MAG: formimidoylglutamate deiminase [Phycisphaerae bacterium]|nr:formimidoylglutamate deiminase [Phycisphaerae bacterium]